MEKLLMPKVNNRFYNDLGDRWYLDQDHPVALLRAESHIKLKYVLDLLRNEKFEPGATVVDIGCGAGFIANPLAKSGYRVQGIDIAEGALVTARKYSPLEDNPIYLTADAYNLPQENQSVDTVLMLDFLEHIDDMPRALAEVKRILKPEGLFVFHTFNRTWTSYALAIKAVEWFSRGCPEHMHVYHLFRRPEEVTKELGKLDMEVKEIIGIRPQFESRAFWKTILTRRLSNNFEFKFTTSLKVGYIGYATHF